MLHSFNQALTLRGPRLQSVQPGVVVLFIQSVPPVDILGVREAQVGIPPNIHPTQQDLFRQKKHMFSKHAEWKNIAHYLKIFPNFSV